MTMISNFILNFINFCVIVSFLTKLLILVFFSTAVRAVVVAKLVILGISFLISFILVLGAVLVAKLVIRYFIYNIFYLCIIQLSLFFLKNLVLEDIHLFILCLFLSIQLLNKLSYPFHLTYSLSLFLFITFSTLNSF